MLPCNASSYITARRPGGVLQPCGNSRPWDCGRVFPTRYTELRSQITQFKREIELGGVEPLFTVTLLRVAENRVMKPLARIQRFITSIFVPLLLGAIGLFYVVRVFGSLTTDTTTVTNTAFVAMASLAALALRSKAVAHSLRWRAVDAGRTAGSVSLALEVRASRHSCIVPSCERSFSSPAR